MSSQTESTQKRTAQRDFDLWNGQDADAADDLYAADARITDPMGEVHDLDSYKAYMEMIWTAFPDFYLEADEWIEEGNAVVARYTFGGTMEGPFRGFEPNGESFEMHGIAEYHVEDGEIVEAWNATNSLAMIKQLGLL